MPVKETKYFGNCVGQGFSWIYSFHETWILIQNIFSNTARKQIYDIMTDSFEITETLGCLLYQMTDKKHDRCQIVKLFNDIKKLRVLVISHDRHCKEHHLYQDFH